jgi:inositol transporter-like SP family MFS transporter
MASYLDAGAIVTTGIALVLYSATLGIDPGTLGLLSGLLTLCFAIGAVIGGRLGDRYGRKRVYSFTLILFALGVGLLAGSVAVPMLFVGVVLTGLAIGADLPVSLAMIAEEAPEGKKGRMIVFSGMLWLLGILAVIVLSIFVAPLGELGGRIMYGHLLLVALIVLIARSTLRESAEWTAAKVAAEGTHSDEIKFSSLPQLFVAPVVFTVIATGLYYAIWNLGANTFGQFGTFFWVNLAGSDVQTASLLQLATFPLGIVGALIFMRIVDKPGRKGWFIAGTIINVIAFASPFVLGPSSTSLTILFVLFGVGAAFAGEAMYKVWSQELFPTLLRSTAQGVTLAFARTVAALFAFGTPAIAVASPQLLFGLLVAFAIVSGLIGLFWIPRLPKATQLEPGVTEAEKQAVSAKA